MIGTDETLKRYELEAKEQWREIMGQVPAIEFPPGCKVTMIPPFGGAVARFKVLNPFGEEKSVYLDWYDNLGAVGTPYWEVYPVRGDAMRCMLNETDELIRLIMEKEDADDPTDTVAQP